MWDWPGLGGTKICSEVREFKPFYLTIKVFRDNPILLFVQKEKSISNIYGLTSNKIAKILSNCGQDIVFLANNDIIRPSLKNSVMTKLTGPLILDLRSTGDI